MLKLHTFLLLNTRTHAHTPHLHQPEHLIVPNMVDAAHAAVCEWRALMMASLVVPWLEDACMCMGAWVEAPCNCALCFETRTVRFAS